LIDDPRIQPKAAPERTVATEPTHSVRRNAERPLRILLVASIVLPILIFSGVAWIAYREYFSDAQRRLETTAGQVYEHAVKVFETFELTARYTDELFDDVTDQQILADEAQYHGRLKTLVETLPQLRDILVIDRNGHPLVSATFFPTQHGLDLSDRDYFVAIKNDPKASFISGIFQSRFADRHLFVISRRRLLNGSNQFEGVVTTGIAPEYFVDYYARLPMAPGSVFALMRGDGAELARYPQRQDVLARPAQTLFELAVKSSPEQGSTIAVSPADGVERMLSYRRLPRQDVYVVVAVPTYTIVHEWLLGMGRHLFFGVPATIAMVVLAWVALVRTQRESLTYAQLHEEVARRESTEEALRQAQKMEAIGRLTGGIAHDFNNLLTAILGNIDLAVIRLGNVEERVSRNLASAREASRRAATLVNRLLSFSRQHPLEVKIVDINRLVQNMSDLLRRAIGETVTVETVLAGGLWRASVDPNQLENAVLNLAVNARDAMAEGGKLTIETANTYLDEAYASSHAGEVAPGQYVMLAVTDSGAGMSKEIADRVFEPFFTTKPPGVGTGLGLSMVYGFVKQSGGHIKIYSEVGEGTTIKLYFPRSGEVESALIPDDAAKSAAPATGQPTETILLVEDDEEVSRFAAEVLREAGYRVVTARDAAHGLSVLERRPEITLLFTDVVLPGGTNGRQLVDEARRRYPHLKVLYATGYTRNAIIHQGRLDADVELLTKPFTHDALVRKVRQVLDAGGAAGRRKAPAA
jgi:two-component system NtrC family sensor kinase